MRSLHKNYYISLCNIKNKKIVRSCLDLGEERNRSGYELQKPENPQSESRARSDLRGPLPTCPIILLTYFVNDNAQFCTIFVKSAVLSQGFFTNYFTALLIC